MKTRWLLVLVFLLGPITGSWGADDLKPSEVKTKQALQAVITGQLDAFRKDDYAGAFIYADSAIKNLLSLERFVRMVKLGYPAIAHSISGRCGLAFDNGDEAVVNVRVFSEGREPVDYQYTLRLNGDVWCITGVTLLKDQTTEV